MRHARGQRSSALTKTGDMSSNFRSASTVNTLSPAGSGGARSASVHARGTRSVVPSPNRTTSCVGPCSMTCPASG